MSAPGIRSASSGSIVDQDRAVWVNPWASTKRAAGADRVVAHQSPATAWAAILRQHLSERLGFLRAGNGPLAVDHVGGHRGDAVLVGVGELGGDLLGAPIGREERNDLVAVESDLGRAVGQHVGVADVQTVGEVRLEQPLLHRVLRHRRFGLAGEPDETMRQQGVGPQRAVHVELEADTRRPSSTRSR